MKKYIISILLILIVFVNSFSQEIVRLYKDKAPGSENWNYEEVRYLSPYFSKKCVRNVVDPTLEIFMPDESLASGTAVVVCPGGGNYYLEYENEGTAVAEWLVKKGVTAFVLKYRVNKTPESKEDFDQWILDWNKQLSALIAKQNNNPDSVSPIMRLFGDKFLGGEDGKQALTYVREHANEYGINPDKVGIMGFSAGAAVCMYIILNSDPKEQPNFAGTIYGGWLGGLKVPNNAPPLFITAAANDPIVINSPNLYKAWKTEGKSVELHIYRTGGHGFGMKENKIPTDTWINRFYEWLIHL